MDTEEPTYRSWAPSLPSTVVPDWGGWDAMPIGTKVQWFGRSTDLPLGWRLMAVGPKDSQGYALHHLYKDGWDRALRQLAST